MSSANKKSAMPKEMINFACKMGLDLKGLEPEAEEMWQMLDNMAKNDPIGYEAFIAEQLSENRDLSDKKDENQRSLRPQGTIAITSCTMS